jgi:hypothetical protein
MFLENKTQTNLIISYVYEKNLMKLTFVSQSKMVVTLFKLENGHKISVYSNEEKLNVFKCIQSKLDMNITSMLDKICELTNKTFGIFKKSHLVKPLNHLLEIKTWGI